MNFNINFDSVKEMVMKIPAWRLVLISVTALLIVLFMFADKVAVLVNVLK